MAHSSTKTYFDSPFGIAVHPWLNAPDVKFNPEGLFKTGLRLLGADAERLKAKIDAEAQAAFEDFFENGDGKAMTPAERKKMSIYVPYELEEDPQTGDPTGAIVFNFKQNATIKIKATGETKKITIGLYDAAGKAMDKRIWGGSEIRVNFAMRPIAMKALKQVGVKLDFGRVQVKTLAASSGGGGGGFGAVDGYEDDGQGFGGGEEADSPALDEKADY
jgi:hypothetical protein